MVVPVRLWRISIFTSELVNSESVRTCTQLGLSCSGTFESAILGIIGKNLFGINFRIYLLSSLHTLIKNTF